MSIIHDSPWVMVNIKAKKHLGQNFLRNNDILKKIVGEVDVQNQNIVEIGPGPGDLTQVIQQQKPKSLTLIEIDRDMVPLLQTRFHNKNISIYLADVLEVNVISGKISDERGICVHENTKIIPVPSYHLYGNIPYYITSPILHHFFYDVELLPEVATFTMQKEVAERILARDNKHSVLSLACQLVAEIEKICDINPNNFTPVPKVWSTCLRFHIKKNISLEKNKKIIKIVELGFSHKRKKLISNLQGKYTKESLYMIFMALHIDENARAEDITLEQWTEISEYL